MSRAIVNRFGLMMSGLLLCLTLIGNWANGAENKPAQAPAPAAKVFRAGAAMSNVTPPLGELIVGGFNPVPSTHVHDELHARCLVLDDGTTRLAIVVCDNVGIPREIFDAAKRIIQSETGLPSTHVLMAATHTHSATSLRGPNRLLPFDSFNEYQRFYIRRIADGVRRAINQLQPAQIGWGAVDEPSQLFNRRWLMSDEKELRTPFGGVDKVRMNPPRTSPHLVKPAGPTDPQVSFLSVQSKTGRPIALFANYSLHYVGGVAGTDISADYFAVFADRIGQLLATDRLNPPFVGILSNGTSGDVNNIDFTKKTESLPPYEKMRQVAHLIADRVYEGHRRIKFHDHVSLAAAQEELTLAFRKPTAEQLAWAAATLAKPENVPRYHPNERAYAERIKQLAAGPDHVEILLQALRIGDLGIAAIPFEVFTETGLQIKRQSSLQPTFNMELANGSYGYLPTPPQHALGGYETWLGTNIVEIEASTKIAQTILGLLAQVKK